MSYVDWKIHGDETLAAYLDTTQFQGVLERRIAIAPDCAAIVIRDGKVATAMHGAHLSFGGLWQSLKEAIGGKHATRILVCDLKPFPLAFGYECKSQDDVEIAAEVVLELALDPSKPANAMGLIRKGSALTRADVLARIEPHLKERVLTHQIAEHRAAELRANRGLQDKIQSDVMKEVDRLAGDLGLLVRAVSVNFGRNADEEQAIEIRSLERDERMREFEYQRARRDLEREAQSTLFELRTAHDVEKIETTNETEIGRLLLSREIDLVDARSSARRLEEFKQSKHELELAQANRLAQLDARIGDERNELERRKIELERKRADMAFGGELRRHSLELDRLEKLQDIELKKHSALQALEVAGNGHELQARKLRDLQQIDLEGEKARQALAKDTYLTHHGADMDRRLHDSQSELEKLRLQASMSPDHLLALQAGMSPEVARVFVEKARVLGADREALLREMLEMSKQAKSESDAQSRGMFERAVDRMSEMGGASPSEVREGGKADGFAECPKCHFKVPMNHRFCKNCGNAMRT